MSSSQQSLLSLVSAFRMSELQSLLMFAGKSKAGKKTELQARAADLVKLNTSDINIKIQELSNNMYRSLGGGASTSSSSSYSNPCTESIPSSSSSYKPVYPTFPDVTLRKLPFYRVEEILLKPSSLQPTGSGRFHDQTFTFYLTPSQSAEITNSGYRSELGRPEYRTQIIVRFSLLETSCEQEDNFPPSISLKVNNKLCPLPNPVPNNKPGLGPRRPPRPVPITALSQLNSTTANTVSVSWTVEVGKAHTISVYLVESLSYQDLLEQLKNIDLVVKAKGLRQPDYTVALIKEKLADKDQEIATTSCKVSLACPLGKMRMNFPCRASTCDHLQCFDAALYLQMNEKKPKWICPVCNKPALVDNLLIDGFFTELIRSPRLPADEHEIVLHTDGTWEPLPHRLEAVSPADLKKDVDTLSVEDEDDDPSEEVIITLDSEDEDVPEETTLPPKKRARLDEDSSPEIICLDDDDDDDDGND